jgi:PAS domain S-box-containing protein
MPEVNDLCRVASVSTGPGGLARAMETGAELYRVLVDCVEEYAIYVIDTEGRVVSWNRGAEALKGYAEDEVRGRSFALFYTEEDRRNGIPERNLHRAAEAGRYADEGWRVRKDGSRFWASVSLTALANPQGEVVGFAKITRDLTERKLREETLGRSEARFRALAENATEAIVTINSDDEILFANPAAERIFGYSADELRRLHFSDLMPERMRERHRTGLKRYVATRQRRIPWDGVELPGLTRAGEEVPLEITFSEYGSGDEVQFTGVMRDVRERRRVEELLQRNEQRYRSVVEAAAAIVWVVPPSGEIEWPIPSWSAFTGQTWEQYGGRGWIEAVHPDDRHRTAESWRHAMETRSTYEAEHRLRRHDGEYRYMLVRAVPIVDEEGEVREWVGIHTDITLQRETALRLRRLSDSGLIGIVVVETSGAVLEANEAFLRMVGHSREDLEAGRMNWVAMTPEEYRDLDRQARQEAARTGQVTPFEKVFLHRDGTPVWVLIGSARISETRSVAFVLNISRRKTAEQERERLIRALTAERQRLADLFEQAPAIVAVVRGGEHVFEIANPRFLRFIGRSAQEVVGRPIREAMPELAGQGYFDLLDRVYSSGEPFIGQEMPVQLRRSDDAPLEQAYMNFIYHPLREADGSVSGIFAHGVDVTDQVLARQRVEELLREVQEANQVKGGFLATMSHELRTPLNAMIGYADLLLEGIPEPIPEPSRAQVERIGLSARHLLELIEEILTFSRIEAGRERVDAEDVELSILLKEVAAIIEPLATQKGLTFQIQLPAETISIRTDARKLRQILLNLAGNAIKFTEQGRICVRLLVDAETVKFEVEDTGIGIAPEHHERVFEPFWQVDSEKTRQISGTGLGLKVSRELARLLGGDIDLRADLGKGTCFTVELPRRAEAIPETIVS